MLTIIQIETTENGMHGLQSQSGRTESWLEGWIAVPKELEAEVWATGGWCDLVIEDGVLVGITPTERPGPDIGSVRNEKENQISAECNAAIVAGMDVETSTGIEHFSLEETDQINLTTALSAIQNGAEGYPYHADGKLCRMFSAEEIVAISNASVQHKLYHTTLCNHLLTWIRRAEIVDEINNITYSEDNLPDDLKANMNSILNA